MTPVTLFVKVQQSTQQLQFLVEVCTMTSMNIKWSCILPTLEFYQSINLLLRKYFRYFVMWITGEGPIWLDDVFCVGNETRIEQCEHRVWGTHDCSHDEDAAVMCQIGEDTQVEK